ncbi:MAG: hypothetical protein U0L79_05660 [Lachnospiraceae bacterium]|nr:hypothetical protein [Lachnospiraceae bacterium]
MEDFVNMKYVIDVIQNRSGSEIISEKKIREKLIELFDVLDVDRDLLKKEQKSVNDYLFPKKSLEFLCWLYDFYLSEDGKALRRGHVYLVETKYLDTIISGVKEMFQGIGLSENIIEQELEKIKDKLGYKEIVAKRKILNALQEICLDFFPEEPLYIKITDEDGNEKPELGRFRIPYHYDKLGKENVLTLLKFIHDDIEKRQQIYRVLYFWLNEEYELDEDVSIYRGIGNATEAEMTDFREKMEEWLEYRKMLVADERYKELMAMRDDIRHENTFEKKKMARMDAIDEKVKELEKEIQKTYFNGRTITLPQQPGKMDKTTLTLERCKELYKMAEESKIWEKRYHPRMVPPKEQ